ncbi:hypothetical protein Gohar_021421 [Gossypium harknessii]|uniref:Uncharacterized protein n=1 Tax=Gossypium harknessii TaxID=34285 RepID=A0A7J9IC57_9ROSI|nr:hypothetical protein [Gossypium harknessii]
MASSSLTSLEDKATKKVHMRNNGLGEDDHLMVMDEDRNPNEFDKLSNSRLSFKDMLLGLSRDAKQSLHDQDNEDLQLLDGDVITRTEDELLSIQFFERVHHILYQSMSRTVVVKLMGRKIRFQTLSNKIYHL